MVLDRPLKVLLAYRSDVDIDGGAGHVMNGTAAGLRSAGVDVDITYDVRPDVRGGYDLVHVFNIWSPETARAQMRYIHDQGLPLVWQPIYLRQSEAYWAILASRAVFASDRTPDDREGLLQAFTAGTLRVNNFDRWTPNGSDLELVPYVREMAELADHICCCSHHEAQGLFQTARLASRPFTVVPHGVDRRLFADASPEAFRSRLGMEDDYVLSVGSVDGRKNQLFLAEALRGTGLKLVLIGPCWAPDYLELVRQRLGDSLTYFDRLPQELVASALAGARVHALPSYAEGSALASMEAATAGCPIVVSNRSSEFEYYGDLAFYCDPTDPASIRNAVLGGWESRTAQPSRGDALRQRMTRYSWEAAGAATLDVYRRTLADVSDRRRAHMRRAAGTTEARAFACLVRYEELIAEPDVLATWCATFGADEAATLVVYAPGVSSIEIEAQLQPLLSTVELQSGNALDVLAIAPPAAADYAVAEGVDGVLSNSQPRGELARLPHVFSRSQRDLRSLGERVWREKLLVQQVRYA